jgi:hypothetical protein
VIARRALLGALPATAFAQEPLATAFELPARGDALRPLGGLELHRRAIGFGGFSGLHLAPDLTMTVISDRGPWFAASLLLDGDRPIGLGPLRLGLLRDAQGAPLRRGRLADAEALLRRPDGTWLVAFEGLHRIRAYRDLDAVSTPFEAPPGLDAAPENGGLESLALLADGRLLAITERKGQDGVVAAWTGGPGGWRRRLYRPAPGFAPTDAAGLPDGGALVLERRFSLLEGGFTCRLVHVTRAALAGEGEIAGAPLLLLPPDAPAENWEGVAVLPRGREWWIALLSDDNESLFQRSLFALYAWAPA